MTSKNNEIMNTKLDHAQFCVAFLEAKGVTVTGIEIKDAKPVITIQSHTAQAIPDQVAGLKRSFTEHARNWQTYATELEGCQVEWTIPAARKTA
jgi:hypothetical protein